MSSRISHLLTLWKQARLPWRSRVFVGTDLSGNEYYESVTALNGRTRRIVEMKEKKLLSDYEEDALPVQWQSWLRHTRYDPPTIDEIKLANKRRETIIQKAKAFDKEWEERKKASSSPSSPTSPVKQNQPLETKDKKDTPFEPESWNPEVAKK
ncbi:hypothetical protein Glove_197g79 [Diversispora epigaea]|uniref:NADH dehydrogenase [ubiquinone] 1 alpha subcomplex subunit n=1 Tax=Diversispora epigaea TaxID=1348612 RepID=A0A397IKJ5_9GLOM|nr:hypothetical protein Glove_197g79 [Diversispora epigaea]